MRRTTKAGASKSEGGAAAPSTTQADRAYGVLRRMILDNELTVGERLLEVEAADRLAMSRTPVREAMLRLSVDGLVELRARHGMTVLPMSAKDLEEIYDVLTAIEACAAELAARRRPTSKELAGLERAIAGMESALKRDDLQAWAAADEKFHLTLVKLSGNRRIEQVVERLWDQSHRARLATLRLRPRPDASNADHRAVLEAIRQHRPAVASRLHRDHRRRNARMLLAIVRASRLTL